MKYYRLTFTIQKNTTLETKLSSYFNTTLTTVDQHLRAVKLKPGIMKSLRKPWDVKLEAYKTQSDEKENIVYGFSVKWK